MTDYARYNLVVQDESGNVVDGASISVQNETTLAFPQLYSTRTGTAALGNPFTATDGADAGFHVTGGAYKITATLGAFSRTWRYVAIGTATENDIGALAAQVSTLVAGWYNVKDFGALGDSSTDDTAAIQDALDTVPTNGALYFPNGFYKVLGSGSTALLRVDPIHIFGDGQGSGIFCDPAFPVTRDILSFIPGGSAQGYHIHDIGIFNAGFGRDALVFDAGVTALIFQVHIHNMVIGDPAFVTGDTGRSIHIKGNVAYSTIERCNLACIRLNEAGDGFTIRENVIGSSFNPSVEASFTGGAAGFVCTGNVLAGLSAAVVLHDQGISSVISNNEIETPAGQNNIYGFLIDIGATSGVVATKLIGNSYSVLTGSGNPVPIRIRTGCASTMIDEARFLNQSGNFIQIDSGSSDTIINRQTWCNTNGVDVQLNVTNNGIRTAFINSEMVLRQGTDTAGSDVNTAQTWFPGGGTTSMTLKSGTVYEFEGLLMISKTAGTSSRTIGINFTGTASYFIFRYAYDAAAADATSFTGVSNTVSGYLEVATNVTVFGIASTSANQVVMIKIKGFLISNAAGTIIPNFQYSAAPGGAPTVRQGSYFKMRETT